MTSGVSQVSIHGPMLFLIRINDIINCYVLEFLSFADDTTVYKSGPHVDSLIDNKLRINIFVQLVVH